MSSRTRRNQKKRYRRRERLILHAHRKQVRLERMQNLSLWEFLKEKSMPEVFTSYIIDTFAIVRNEIRNYQERRRIARIAAKALMLDERIDRAWVARDVLVFTTRWITTHVGEDEYLVGTFLVGIHSVWNERPYVWCMRSGMKNPKETPMYVYPQLFGYPSFCFGVQSRAQYLKSLIEQKEYLMVAYLTLDSFQTINHDLEDQQAVQHRYIPITAIREYPHAISYHERNA